MSTVANLPTPLFLTGVFFLGLMVGSFLNVVILRLPKRLEHDWRCQCRELLELNIPDEPTPPGIVWGQSHCPDCGRTIRPLENIPVLSWLVLRGRCAGCGKKISLRYPLVELLTAVAFTVVALQLGPSWTLLAGLVLVAFLVVLSGIDIDHHLLPDNLTLLLLWLGLAASLCGFFTTTEAAVIGALTGYLSLWLVFQVFRLLTGKEGMGYGDFKLMAALGAWLGWQALPLILIVASLLGAVTGIGLMLSSRLKGGQPLPFGPFLAAAGFIALAWGDSIVDLYVRISGLA